MSLAPDFEPLAKPEALLRVPVGLASPLWPLFAGMAMSGAAWWWMTRWTQPANLEAMFGRAALATTAAEAVVEPAVERVAEALVEATPEPVAETPLAPIVEPVRAAETVITEAAEPVLEAPEAMDEIVGGEAAPVSPALEAIAPEPVVAESAALVKPKRKAAAAKDATPIADAPAAD